MPLQVGLVIDLTNTDRYYGTGDMGNEFAYHQQQFDGEPIHHIKAGASTAVLAVAVLAATEMQLTCSVLQIRCRGRGAAPDPAAANEFCWALVDFGLYLKEADLKRWVVVHCTHGYNRTGRWFCQGLNTPGGGPGHCGKTVHCIHAYLLFPAAQRAWCSYAAHAACWHSFARTACQHLPGKQPTGRLEASQALLAADAVRVLALRQPAAAGCCRLQDTVPAHCCSLTALLPQPRPFLRAGCTADHTAAGCILARAHAARDSSVLLECP